MPELVKTLYEEFYEHFQATRVALSARLQTFQSGDGSGSVQDIAQEVAKLRRSLVDATTLLPSYDKRQCELQMTELEKAVERLRPLASMKPKFAFKRKAGAKGPPASQTGHTDASTPSALNQIQDPSTFHNVCSRSHSYLSRSSLPPAIAAAQSDLTIADLDHCIVDLCAYDSSEVDSLTLTALHIRGLRDCIVLLPPVQGSIQVHDLARCIILVACHQFRMHTSNNVRVYLAVQSNPVIEQCTGITFTPYPASVLSPRDLSSLPVINKYDSIQDFSHVRSTPSPNWTVVQDSGSNNQIDWLAAARLAETDSDEAIRKYSYLVNTPT